MKKIYLFLPMILSFALLTCEKEPEPEPDPPPPKTLDQRLVGGRWYFWNYITYMAKTENGYYEFKNEFVFIHSDKSNFITEYSVYTKNNTVYRKDTNEALLQYQFITTYPYENSSEFWMDGDTRNITNGIAANNNLISCTVSDQNMNLIDNSTSYQYKFLRRYREDGTTYEY